MKQRPQSGGPSPDRHKLVSTKVDLKIVDSDASSFKFMQPKLMNKPNPRPDSKLSIKEQREQLRLENERKKKEIFEDSREASIAIFKAQSCLKNTQKEIQKSILLSEQNLQKYKDVIAKYETDLGKKIEEKFEEFNYVSNDNEELEGPNSSAKKKFKEKLDKTVEYKWAFGQRIPVHYEWKVKQKEDINVKKVEPINFYSEPKQKPKQKVWEYVYDQNGKAQKQKVKK